MAFEARGSDPVLQSVADKAPEILVSILSRAGVQTTPHALRRDAGGGNSELRVVGNVERTEAGVVINSQVIDRKTGIVLLASQTAGPADNAGGAAAASLAEGLYCALEDRKRARKPLSREAFSLYLNTCASILREEECWRTLTTTRRLLKAAPDFANAYAMHAVAAACAASETTVDADAVALRGEANAAAARALKLDPRTPKAYFGLALNDRHSGRTALTQNWLAEESHLQEALALDPDLPWARTFYMSLLRDVGRWTEAVEGIAATNGAVPRGGSDPRGAMMLAAGGDLAGAEAVLRRIEATDQVSMDDMRSLIAFWWEDPRVGVGKVRRLASAGDPAWKTDCREQYLRRLVAHPAGLRGLPDACKRIEPAWRVRMLARQGDLEGAFAEMRPSMHGGTVLFYYPEMAAVRRDPRFWALARQVGLVAYWRDSGHWPDFCRAPGLAYDCRAMAAATAAPPSLPNTGGQ